MEAGRERGERRRRRGETWRLGETERDKGRERETEKIKKDGGREVGRDRERQGQKTCRNRGPGRRGDRPPEAEEALETPGSVSYR